MSDEHQIDLEIHEIMQKMRNNPVAGDGEAKFFTCESGDKLFHRIWKSKTQNKIILGIHGFAAHSEYYCLIADQVVNHGVTVIGLDLKHHGRSSGVKGTVEHFDELFEQVHELIQDVSQKNKGIPIFLMGLSMGGMFVINYSCMYPEDIAGIIGMAPAVKAKVKLTAKDVIKLPYLVFMHLAKKNKPIVDISDRSKTTSRNPLRLEYDEKDPYRMKKVSSNYLLSVNKRVKQAFKNAPNISHPILIMMGTEDLLVSHEGVKEFFSNITLEDKTLIEVKDSFHSLYSDPAMFEEGGWEKFRNWVLEH